MLRRVIQMPFQQRRDFRATQIINTDVHLNLLIVVANFRLGGEFGVDVGEHGAHVGF